MGGHQLLFRSLMHNKVTDFANIYVNTMKSSIIEGCFAIHKPPGITSAQVIRDVQKHFDPSKLFKPMTDAELVLREASRSTDPRQKKKMGRRRNASRPPSVKMGHGGTLDPMATGVLVLGVGIGTKSLPKFLECTKTYETVLLFGAATDTYDTTGKIVLRKPYEHVTQDIVEEALSKFRGKIMQRPPLFSALRVQGKRLYEYAREGKQVPVEIKERPVEVLELEMLEWMDGGSHEWQWPIIEAPPEEKEFAEKALDLEGTAVKAEGTGESHSEVDGRSDITTAQDKAAPLVSSGDLVTGAQPIDTSQEVQTERPIEINTKRKREDDQIATNGAIDAAPSPKRIRSPSNAAREATSAPPTDDATSMNGEDTAQATTISPDSETTRPPCPAPAARIRMTVTSGFYVRSLCQDLGIAVGSVSTMASLVRSRQADFSLGTNVLPYENLAKGEEVWGPQVQQMLEDWQGKQKLAKQDESIDDLHSRGRVEQSIEKGDVGEQRKSNHHKPVFKRRNTSSEAES